MSNKTNEPKNPEALKNHLSSNFSGDPQTEEEITEDLIYKKLIYFEQPLLSKTNFFYKIIEICLMEFEIQKEIRLINKRKMRNISYLSKLMKNNDKLNNKMINKEEYQKIVSQFFILFIKNIYTFATIYKKWKNKENNIKMFYLNKILKIILETMGISYLSGLITDENFELLVKNILNFSLKSGFSQKENTEYELTNIMFFDGAILLVKIVFNRIYLVEKQYSERQKDLIKNIINHINNIMGFSDKNSMKKYSNKFFLYNNDYKTSLLLDLSYIITKMKSAEISNQFFNLLTNIYSFSFNYENSMKPILKLIEPLLLNLNNKNLEEFLNELELADFPLDYLNALNKKEKLMHRANPYIIKNGFYFENKLGGIYGDINNNFENDFVILFSFRLVSDQLSKIVIFELYNEEKTQIKFFLTKDLKNKYELVAVDGDKEKSTRINIYPDRTYIFELMFTTEGFRRHKSMKMLYVSDNDDKSEKKEIINSGAEIKFKNIDNIKGFSIGCERDKFNKNLFLNKFEGFIGNFIILNAKHIKENMNSYNEILKLKNNYYYIIKILLDENSLFEDKSFNLEFNSSFNECKKIYEDLKINTEFKKDNTINTFVCPKYFKLVEYQDDIDYLNLINNYDYYTDKLEVPFSIKLKYLNYKMKSDPSNSKKLTINSSVFSKNFTIFERKFSLIEFVKYDGVHYLSLLFEYYYQIICYLTEIKKTLEENTYRTFLKNINEKMIKLINFFCTNIIQTNLCECNFVEIEQFFYQMTTAILKFVEVEDIEFETIKCIIDFINVLDNSFDINKKEVFYSISLIKQKLVEFLLNPRLYKREKDSCLEKLNYVLFYILTFLFKVEIDYFSSIFSVPNLEKLISFSWLLDEPQEKQYFEETKKSYISLLILFLQMSTSVSMNSNESSNEIQDSNNGSNSQNILKIFSRNNEDKDKNNENKLLISDFFKMILKYSKNQYIFFNLSLILIKTNLISLLKESDIDIAKSYFLREFKNFEFVHTDYKKTIFFSHLQILIAYYFSDTKHKSSNVRLENLIVFIHSLNLDQDLFYAFIALIKYINNFSQIDKVNIYGYKTQEMKTIKKKDYPIFSDLPMRELQIEQLTEIEIYIIKNIFLNVIFLLDKFGKRFKKDNSNNDESNIEKEFFEAIKKNVDIVFKYPNTRLYEMMFSCESNICTKLFMVKLENGLENDIDYIKKVLKIYYNQLVRNCYCPFIFKYILEISSENILLNEPNIENKDDIVSDLKSDILIFIIETLNDFSKELKKSKEKMPFYFYNLLNCLIVLNEELNYKYNNLSLKKNLYDSIYVLISLVSEGLLYSNFCIEFKNRYGKIISEIIFDIMLAIPSEFFKPKIFINTFIKSKEKMTIFYIMDNFREKIIERKKVKNPVNFPELNKMKEIHNILLSFNPEKIRKNLVEENINYQIEDVNFTIYFLVKSFVYLRSNFFKENQNHLKALNLLIPCLAEDLYSLFTKNKNFYSTKRCSFPIYDETKKFFELYTIQNYNYKGSQKIDGLKKFFENDLLVIIKDEYNLDYCYSSRLYKVKSDNENDIIKEKDDMEENYIDFQITKSQSENKRVFKKKKNPIYMYFPDKDFESNPNLNNAEMSLDNIVLMSNDINELTDVDIQECPNSFEIFDENLIINPKNFFLKIKFSNVYKDILFFNKTFIKIKKFYSYLLRNEEGLVKESKQKNYPTSQKNYSNFLEPRIFLKRDSNYYDKIFFPISFCYLPESFKNRKLEELFFYKHKFKFDKRLKTMVAVCELVTNLYIYFGKLYIYEDYIIFESKEDPRDDPKKEFDVNTFIDYSISTKVKNKHPVKYKFVVICLKNVKEIIKRRTLLITQSLEIFLKNGKSFFFNFFKSILAEEVYKFFDKAKNRFDYTFDINDNHKEIKDILSQFHNGKITNYDYLLYLNKYSTRTYCDLSQYPIFPWIILDYENIDKVNESPEILRNLKYPISVQNEDKRKKCIDEFKKEFENVEEECEENDENEEKEFPHHFQFHYSTCAFVYYYLMRLNPYGRDMIKLQNYKNENPNRIFHSFNSFKTILNYGTDNRELIPDFYCYFDFLINLNCCWFGKYECKTLNDDFLLNSQKLSTFVYYLYMEKKLLNNIIISKKLHEWVDYIFGKNQLPDLQNKEESAESCNIFHKYGYEQITNLEKQIESSKAILTKRGIEKDEIVQNISELKIEIGFTINFGMTPKQILKSSNIYEEENKLIINEINKSFEDKLIYYEKLSNDDYIFLKGNNKKDKYKIKSVSLYTYRNKSLNESKIYECKSLNLMKKYKSISIENKIKNKKMRIPLYNPCYSVSYLELKSMKKNKYSNIIILTCRYLGNYFNVQSVDKNINIYLEDFITSIKANNKESSQTFYTGLFNGKLIEWEINPNFEVKEIKHVYSHSSSITLIELYNRQNIIITASEDKFIHIRKQYDFELLTSINLNYCYAQPSISQKTNIFPSLIKISDLNLLYVLLYDLDSETNFIRGYNLNGLFFAQTKENLNKENNKNIIINNISFTKNSNLIIGFYNSNNFVLLQSWDLNVHRKIDIKANKDRELLNMLLYEPSLDMVNLLYDNEFIKTSLGEEHKVIDL